MKKVWSSLNIKYDYIRLAISICLLAGCFYLEILGFIFGLVISVYVIAILSDLIDLFGIEKLVNWHMKDFLGGEFVQVKIDKNSPILGGNYSDLCINGSSFRSGKVDKYGSAIVTRYYSNGPLAEVWLVTEKVNVIFIGKYQYFTVYRRTENAK